MRRRGLIALLAAVAITGCDSALPRPDYTGQQAAPQRVGPDGLRIDADGYRLDAEGYRIDEKGNRIRLVPPTRDDPAITIMGR
jgi:hypothetical protein